MIESDLSTAYGGLHIREFAGDPPSLVALHGFTLHGGMFAGLAARIGLHLLAPDLPGHGRTTVTPVRMATAVAALAEWLTSLPGPVPVLGYSQGGRVALQLAIGHPALVSHLILVSTSPGLDEADREARSKADARMADHIEKMGIDASLDEWLYNPITATTAVSEDLRRADIELRRENTAHGLAAALRGMGQGATPDGRAALVTLPMPIAIIAGGRDVKYTGVAGDMARSRGEEPIIIPGVGHNVILEDPGGLAAIVREFLQR